MDEFMEKLNSIPMLWVSGLFLLASFLLEYIFPMMEISVVCPVNPAWVSLLISGTPIAYWAVVTVMDKKITSPLLITIAMVAAVYIGDVFAAGEVAFIMAIGEYLEGRTVEKAKRGIELLFNLLPSVGRKITVDASGNTTEEMVEAKNIAVGDILRVLPGESFSADGVIVSGTTTVDQSIITGESLPVDKGEGDDVFTGTMNRFGSVDIQVTKSFANSSLQKMIQLVAEAEEQKAPTQKTVDKWASYLVPSACIIAIITYLVFMFGFQAPDAALTRAVTVLVVFCPCALALATPTSIMAAIGQATKNGVLIKSGEALERMGMVSTVAFDKTGTITLGNLAVSDIVSFVGDENKLMPVVSAVESRSEHPIGKAVVNYAKKNHLEALEIKDFAMQVGKGVLASVDGSMIFCGNEKLMEAINLELSDEIHKKIAGLREEGKAVIIVANESVVMGIVGLSDEIKETSAKAIATLHDSGIKNTILLTGDNEKSANFIAEKVGITEVHASLLPEGKVAAIQSLMEQSVNVCMVGDGVNDAPALKTASVGIAMGTMGSDIAIDAADIAIMGDDISKISYLKKLSDATIFSIKFNITLAMTINCIAIVLSVMGLLTPATGALVHNAGSVLVVLNAARLYDKKII
ncbi:cation-translocating P-type ATPase [Chakrabartyella piscis]|uniref:heavy metal translocating P-type ATPase n=1 Tax=Chakrabartyella piscis TaxID=2918914 RepID=UPI002958B2DB|nr:cation-translocating P-type ATPase [Chakrabartyella piscis]